MLDSLTFVRVQQKETGLLQQIASAEMEQQITKTVLSIARKNKAVMREETGLATSLEDEGFL